MLHSPHAVQKQRKRCENACDNCKRKKDRCDGGRPCSMCTKRNHACRYSQIPAKALTEAARQRIWPDSLFVTHDEEHSPAPGSEAPVPRTARFLSDGSGRYNYIGDSASLSFLQSAKLIVHSALGDCDFTFIMPPSQASASNNINVSSSESRAVNLPQLSAELAEWLVNAYLTSTGCLIDLFDANELTTDVRRWAAKAEAPTKNHKSSLLLVLAVGSQMDPRTQDRANSDDFFVRGRQLAFDLMTDEPSVPIVQAFALISMYLLGENRSNIAFMNLGIAIRAAYTLGLHRRDYESFDDRELLARERAWKTVRVLDIFLSASTGRPPATSDHEKDSVPSIEAYTASTDDIDERFSWATLSLCAIGERVLVDVYKKRSVSTTQVHNISEQIKEWVSKIPHMPAALELQTKSLEHVQMARTIASAHLMGAYYWAIILLTRPFLLFDVSMRQSQAAYALGKESSGVIAKIAETCIVAAINGMDLIEDVLRYEGLPRRLPVILNSVLNCALTVGIAVFGDYDKTFALMFNLERAVAALKTIGRTDTAAIEYLDIVRALTGAAQEYRNTREQNIFKTKARQFDGIFGAIDSHWASLPVAGPVAFDAGLSVGQPLQDIDPDLGFDYSFASLFDDGLYATLIPSGLLLSRPGSSQSMRA